MQRSCGSKTLVQALALIGLGGTGKTQLVLHYIEQHKKRYDTVLWLDVRDKTTTVSSFQRCCNALSIAFERQTTDGLLHDSPSVQSLLKWLAARERDQKWLVVLDNADDLEQLELARIIPQNAHSGSVIITSQDGKAAKLVPRAKCTTVDRMEIEEGKALLAQCMELDLAEEGWEVMSRLEKLVHHLDGIAVALVLADGRIRDDLDNREEMHNPSTDDTTKAAIDQYLLDLRGHKRSMMSDPEQSAASSYKKTIWTVWESVLGSLKRSEQGDAESSAYPLQLLKLAVSLGPKIVHREIFRAASQSFATICSVLSDDAPPWLKSLLRVSATGTWDCYAYDKSLTRLRRFNLIYFATEDIRTPVFQAGDCPLSVSWPGFTMHGLVRWRTSGDTDSAEYETYRTVLMAACCRTCNECENGINFRFALNDYIALDDHVSFEGHTWRMDAFTPEGVADVYTAFGTSLMTLNRSEYALRFLTKAGSRRTELFGSASLKTKHATIELNKLYLLESYLTYNDPVAGKNLSELANSHLLLKRMRPEAEAGIDVARLTADMLQIRPEDCLIEPEVYVMREAALWTADLMHIRLLKWLTQLAQDSFRFETSEDIKAFILEGFQMKYEEFTSIISRQLWALAKGEELLGRHDQIVSTLRSNLAHIYNFFDDFEKERIQLEALLASRQRIRGEFDPQTMQCMERLARCRAELGDHDRAEEIMTALCKTTSIVFGDADPRTHLRERYLGQLDMLKSTTSDNMADHSNLMKQLRASVNMGPRATRIIDVLEAMNELPGRRHLKDAALLVLSLLPRRSSHGFEPPTSMSTTDH